MSLQKQQLVESLIWTEKILMETSGPGGVTKTTIFTFWIFTQ